MALGGRDRTFRAIKRTVAPQGGRGTGDHRSMVDRAYAHVLTNWAQVPDEYWTWSRSAILAGRKLLRTRNIGVILTTAPPYSSLLVGQALRATGVPWVADFRDPLAYTARLSSGVGRIHTHQRNIVSSTLSNADAVTLAASSFASIYHDMFGDRGVAPIFIPTGMDADLVPPPASGHSPLPYPYLIFPGEYLPDYEPAFLEALAYAFTNREVASSGMKLVVIGTLELNRPRLTPLLKALGLESHVVFLDQQPQRDVYRLLQGARAGVLIPGARAYWWTTFAKMTDYIGMRKPVVAVVPDPSEARSALTRSRLGVFLDGSLEKRGTILTDFLLGKSELPLPDEQVCERYTARCQVESFARLFDSLSQPQEQHL